MAIKLDDKPMEELITSSLMQENTELKHKLLEAERLRRELTYKVDTANSESVVTTVQLREQNQEMQKQIEYFQKREKELLDAFQKARKK